MYVAHTLAKLILAGRVFPDRVSLCAKYFIHKKYKILVNVGLERYLGFLGVLAGLERWLSD